MILAMTDERKICVGTSGWSYPRGEGTWKGHFYPPGTSNELAYYSSFFNTVEINSSFYRPPDPKTSKKLGKHGAGRFFLFGQTMAKVYPSGHV